MIIDRFENEFAVIEIENGKTVDMPKSLLPAGAKEGDIIRIIIDTDETEKRKNRLQNRLNGLFKD